uniref:Uncharacterized protein n=1 Tax=Arundo donax TaxID=35708 RepID=A0A0A9B575_ARUDO
MAITWRGANNIQPL